MRDTRPADWRTYTCRWCDQKFKRSARVGRKPQFCCDGCRLEFWARVYVTDRKASFVEGRYTPSRDIGNSPKTSTKSTISNGVFRGRGINLAGVEPETRERIIDLEFAGWRWTHPHEDGGES
jgi:hypothetical protein